MESAPVEWLCRRGMKELEFPLRQYMQENYSRASPEERQRFHRFLQEPDDHLWGWLYADQTMTALPQEYQSLVQQILACTAFDR